MTPVTAAATADCGLARCVRAPGPWRPTKLRFVVETDRSPGGTASPFAARHIEQPGRRHSNPASRKISSRPSASAARLVSSEPGTTHARTPGATRRPPSAPAAARRSDSRAFVHEPMKTHSTGVPASCAPGERPMYSRASAIRRRRCGSGSSAGSGILPSTAITSCGLVPHVIWGAIAPASMCARCRTRRPAPTRAPASPRPRGRTGRRGARTRGRRGRRTSSRRGR